MDIKLSENVVNYSKYNLTDSAVAVLKGIGTIWRVIQSPTKRCGVQRNL